MTERVDNSTSSEMSDYERIGGSPAVSQVVNRFYELVLADEQLVGFFSDVDMARLKRHQVLLISQVLGGPAQYDGEDLQQAHADLDISRDDFGRVVEHLVRALREAEVPGDIIDSVTDVLGGAESDIVTASAR